MKKTDIFIIFILLAVGVAAVGLNALKKNSGEAKVEIYVDGELYDTIIPTGEERLVDIRTQYGYNRLMVYPDGVKMIEADCPSQTCVHTSKRSLSGGISGGVIACLPHKVLVKVTGGDEGEVDAIAE
jgi:hypothetical protein